MYWKDENKEKEARNGPFFKKRINFNFVHWKREDVMPRIRIRGRMMKGLDGSTELWRPWLLDQFVLHLSFWFKSWALDILFEDKRIIVATTSSDRALIFFKIKNQLSKFVTDIKSASDLFLVKLFSFPMNYFILRIFKTGNWSKKANWLWVLQDRSVDNLINALRS